LDLESTVVTETEAKILTQTLTSRIISLGEYTVVERANIDKILNEQKFQHSGCTDSECAVEIGQLLNADLTVIGSVGKIGSTYTIQVRIINVESGEALQSANFTHKGEIDELLSVGVESVAHELLDIHFEKKNENKLNVLSTHGAIINITSIPPNADVYIGDSYYNKTPVYLEDFPTGKYNILIKNEGCLPFKKIINVQPRGFTEVIAELVEIYSLKYIKLHGLFYKEEFDVKITHPEISNNSFIFTDLMKNKHTIPCDNVVNVSDKDNKVINVNCNKDGKIYN
jgi:hypothetical protein